MFDVVSGVQLFLETAFPGFAVDNLKCDIGWPKHLAR